MPPVSYSFLLLSSLGLSDTHVYEPLMRAHFGTALHFVCCNATPVLPAALPVPSERKSARARERERERGRERERERESHVASPQTLSTCAFPRSQNSPFTFAVLSIWTGGTRKFNIPTFRPGFRSECPSRPSYCVVQTLLETHCGIFLTLRKRMIYSTYGTQYRRGNAGFLRMK